MPLVRAVFAQRLRRFSAVRACFCAIAVRAAARGVERSSPVARTPEDERSAHARFAAARFLHSDAAAVPQRLRGSQRRSALAANLRRTAADARPTARPRAPTPPTAATHTSLYGSRRRRSRTPPHLPPADRLGGAPRAP